MYKRCQQLSIHFAWSPKLIFAALAIPSMILLAGSPALSAYRNIAARPYLRACQVQNCLTEGQARIWTAADSQYQDSSVVKLEGFVEFRQDGVYIKRLQNPLSQKIVPASQGLLIDLQKLSTGDFIIGSGRFDPHRQLFVLASIDTVGLQQILGSWRSSSGQIFEFRDFVRLNLYNTHQRVRLARRGVSSPKFFMHRQMTYTLAPESGENIWSIFMADRQGVHIGSMNLSSRKMDLTLYDTVTGQISEKIELSLVARPRSDAAKR